MEAKQAPSESTERVRAAKMKSETVAILVAYFIPVSHADDVLRSNARSDEWNALAEGERQHRATNDPLNQRALQLLNDAYKIAPELRRHIGPCMRQVSAAISEDKRRRKATASLFDIETRRGPRTTGAARGRAFVIEAVALLWQKYYGALPAVGKTMGEDQPFVTMLTKLFRAWKRGSWVKGVQAAAADVVAELRKSQFEGGNEGN